LSDASYPRDLNLEPNSGVCLRGAVGRPQLSASLPRENALQFVQRVDRRGRIAGPRIARLLVGVLRHPRCGIQPHLMPGPLRHYEGDAPPVRGRSSGMSCPVGQDHITLALASFPIGLAAMVADQASASTCASRRASWRRRSHCSIEPLSSSRSGFTGSCPLRAPCGHFLSLLTASSYPHASNQSSSSPQRWRGT
jgi:hypothetical protein